MKLSVAIDKNWAIGYQGDLLIHCPQELKAFKAKTLDAVIVMGRKTLESFPGSKTLPQRENWILSSKLSKLDIAEVKLRYGENIKIFPDVASLLQAVSATDKTVWIIGGGSIYQQFLPYVELAEVTKLDYQSELHDTYFPNLDIDTNWQEIERQATVKTVPVNYQVVVYQNLKVRKFND